eukprot:COSAG02_NODE_2784_length_8036_cov_15.324808_6_plen_92_part_00
MSKKGVHSPYHLIFHALRRLIRIFQDRFNSEFWRERSVPATGLAWLLLLLLLLLLRLLLLLLDGDGVATEEDGEHHPAVYASAIARAASSG